MVFCRVSGRQSPSPSSREQVIVHQEIPLAKVTLLLRLIMHCNDLHMPEKPGLHWSSVSQPEEEEEEDRTEFTVEHLGPADDARCCFACLLPDSASGCRISFFAQ